MPIKVRNAITASKLEETVKPLVDLPDTCSAASALLSSWEMLSDVFVIPRCKVSTVCTCVQTSSTKFTLCSKAPMPSVDAETTTTELPVSRDRSALLRDSKLERVSYGKGDGDFECLRALQS
jgi:hypothetical protein